ncbi:poly-beta-1,6-N-acetyl-D-glucosamine biosynthesis protein PgaD [Oceanisphaera profunda]|uniref:Poly-beta-1,6-N-acetyl-D-glucosamine biosynthesis protein PgaD n=1 Tax=Oceanisphaera profunda TaxID=1416627 RepID=A0A1Y0D3X8_9GAMM|nr:poly-beta-1,6-N-acetyl-D-glucosamine biosynthesis protein PgaD [Oceanisphaera profunda]ART82241.1 poly-beta-1,6-N-acetyl-D-glucosamine biosynthesis protein PgaD [Oceanisphaera profunda]
MSHPLIVTERRILPKLLDSLLTIIAWVGFIWLIYHGVVTVLHAQSEGGDPLSLTLGTVIFYLLIALANSLLLILWAKYNQRRFRTERRIRPQELPHGQLAIQFGLTQETLEQLNQSQIVVVSYNNDGTALEVSFKREQDVISKW